MAPDLMRAICDKAVAEILSHAEELTSLDQAIGDGDHGINMRRGFEAIAAQADELTALPGEPTPSRSRPLRWGGLAAAGHRKQGRVNDPSDNK